MISDTEAKALLEVARHDQKQLAYARNFVERLPEPYRRADVAAALLRCARVYQPFSVSDFLAKREERLALLRHNAETLSQQLGADRSQELADIALVEQAFAAIKYDEWARLLGS